MASWQRRRRARSEPRPLKVLILNARVSTSTRHVLRGLVAGPPGSAAEERLDHRRSSKAILRRWPNGDAMPPLDDEAVIDEFAATRAIRDTRSRSYALERLSDWRRQIVTAARRGKPEG